MATGKETGVTRGDVELCFRVLGIPLDATPAQVEQAFGAFLRRCTKLMSSEDAEKRERARGDLELMKGLHLKIKSLSYRDRMDLMGLTVILNQSYAFGSFVFRVRHTRGGNLFAE